MNALIEFSPTLLTNGWSAPAVAAVDADAHVREHDVDGSLAIETLTRARSLGLSTALVPAEFARGYRVSATKSPASGCELADLLVTSSGIRCGTS